MNDHVQQGGPVRQAAPGDSEDAYLDDLRARQARSWPPDLPRQVTYPLGERPLTEYLRERARLDPERCLLIFYGREFSYAEIDQLSDSFAAFLIAAAVTPGDRVGVMLPNCPQFLIAFFVAPVRYTLRVSNCGC